MMSGHGARSIFIKNKKDWASRTLANPLPPTSDKISITPTENQ